MAFLWLDVAVAVVGLVVLAGFGWALLRRVKALGREVAACGRRLGDGLAELEGTLGRTGQKGRGA